MTSFDGSTSYDGNGQSNYRNEIDKINREYDRLLLKQLALEHSVEEAGRITDQQTPFERSELDRNVMEMIESCQRKRQRKRALKAAERFSRRAASFVIIAALGFAALFFTVDAVKLNVVNLIVRSYEMSTHFNVEDIAGNLPEEIPLLTESAFRHPTRLPEGFHQAAYDLNQLHGFIAYETDESPYVLTYSCMVLSSGISLDTEDCLMEEKTVNGSKAYLYTKYRSELKGHTSLIWYDGSYIHLISGPVSQREIISMAESI